MSVKYKVFVLVPIILSVLFGLLYLNSIYVDNEIVSTILVIIATSIIVGIINEYYLKKTTMDQMANIYNLKLSIIRSGVIDVYSCIDDITYRNYFINAKKNIDIVHSYGLSWTENKFGLLEDICKRKGMIIRVVLLSPHNSLIEGLPMQYGSDSLKQLYEKMNETLGLWKKLYKITQKSGAKLDVYYHYGNPTNSYYKFDNKIVCVANSVSHSGTVKNLPVVIWKKEDANEHEWPIFKRVRNTILEMFTNNKSITHTVDNLYSTYNEDIESIISKSQRVLLEDYTFNEYKVMLCKDDISEEVVESLKANYMHVSISIGKNNIKEECKISHIQFKVRNEIYLIKYADINSYNNLKRILLNKNILKIFYDASNDVKTLYQNLHVDVNNIVCLKTMAALRIKAEYTLEELISNEIWLTPNHNKYEWGQISEDDKNMLDHKIIYYEMLWNKLFNQMNKFEYSYARSVFNFIMPKVKLEYDKKYSLLFNNIK